MNCTIASQNSRKGVFFTLLIVLSLGSLVPSALSAQEIVAYLGHSVVYPIVGPKLSSKYGKRRHPIIRATKHHNGVDLAAPPDALIRSIAAGRVVFADPFKGYGNLVVVEHENGLTSHYGHCSKIHVAPGTRVKAGEIIATVGRTGLATGHHLHFEIRRGGEPLDPEKIFPGLGEEGQG